MSQSKYLAVVSTLLLSTACLAAPGTVIRATDLKEKPFTDAASITQLSDNTAVDVLTNQGGWSQVKTRSHTGWVRLLNVRVGKESSGTIFDRGGAVVRTATTKSTATTGAKGLTKEDIAKAKPNPSEVKRLNNFKASPGAISKFASSRRLRAQDVPEL